MGHKDHNAVDQGPVKYYWGRNTIAYCNRILFYCYDISDRAIVLQDKIGGNSIAIVLNSYYISKT